MVQVVDIDLDPAWALDEQHQAVPAEPSRQVAGLQLLAQQACEVGEEILAREDAELLV
jgi:hypothetical protein